MNREKLHISTVADDAALVAKKYDIGLEIAEYCTAYNMDENFSEMDKTVREEMSLITDGGKKQGHFVFHCPFNELTPAAIDPLVLEVTKKRYLQAAKLANDYGIDKLVIHSGFSHDAYFPIWYEERATEFFTEFLKKLPSQSEIVLENVFERTPEQLLKVVKNINNDRFKLCFDVGHANVVANEKDMLMWLRVYGDSIGHFHIHNNPGDYDRHNNLDDGNIPMKEFLTLAEEITPTATYTIETLHSEPSVQWLIENQLLN